MQISKGSNQHVIAEKTSNFVKEDYETKTERLKDFTILIFLLILLSVHLQ